MNFTNRLQQLENEIKQQEIKLNRSLVLLKADKKNRATNKVTIKTLHKGDETNFPQHGDKVVVQYTGILEDGTIFDSSINKGKPFSFVVNANQVIKGWDIAIVKLSKGERAQIFIPSILAYGDKSVANGHIPANSNLIFDIRLLKIIK